MELRRFFVKDNDINGNIITVTGDEFLHMTKVLRLKKGYRAIVCANDGKERLCVIDEINKNSATLLTETVTESDRKRISLTLYAGLLKNNKLDLVIQKAVELGVDRVVPFKSKNTSEENFNVERASKIALEAAKQCGASYLTQVEQAVDFKDVVNAIKSFEAVLLAYEHETKNSIKKSTVNGSNIALIVGSEGGFKQDEVDAAVSNGALTVTLGRRILRAETADIVATALLLDSLGELDYD